MNHEAIVQISFLSISCTSPPDLIHPPKNKPKYPILLEVDHIAELGQGMMRQIAFHHHTIQSTYLSPCYFALLQMYSSLQRFKPKFFQ